MDATVVIGDGTRMVGEGSDSYSTLIYGIIGCVALLAVLAIVLALRKSKQSERP